MFDDCRCNVFSLAMTPTYLPITCDTSDKHHQYHWWGGVRGGEFRSSQLRVCWCVTFAEGERLNYTTSPLGLERLSLPKWLYIPKAVDEGFEPRVLTWYIPFFPLQCKPRMLNPASESFPCPNTYNKRITLEEQYGNTGTLR